MVSQLTFCCAGLDNFCLVHVSLVPVLGVVGEQVRDQLPSCILRFPVVHLIF
jgi:hypothetical protein